MTGSEPPPPYRVGPERGPEPPRRTFPMLAVIAVAFAVLLAVAVPVGIALASGPHHDPTPSPTVPPTTTTPPAPTPSPSVTSPESTPPATPSYVDDHVPAEQALSGHLVMGGVEPGSCSGYAAGEAIPGVGASLSCTVSDSSISQPIIYYQFDSDASLTSYMNERASEVDSSGGSCDAEEEADTTWSINGATQGRLVCVVNVKDGTAYFKTVFSVPGDDRVFVVQDESASDVLEWVHAHARYQFG